jgi:hypothetical protein
MSKIFFIGFFMLVSSTIAFILAILTPYWIVNLNNLNSLLPNYRGIFQVCLSLDDTYRKCADILLYNPMLTTFRTGTFSCGIKRTEKEKMA